MDTLGRYRDGIQEKVSDITVGYYKCGDNDTVFSCDAEGAHFPRIKLYDFKKEIEYNITTDNFERSFTRIKNFVIPRVLLVKSIAYLDELLAVSDSLVIGYFPSNDTSLLNATKALAKYRKQSTLFFDVSMIDASILQEAKGRFKDGFGLYLWLNTTQNENKMVRYTSDSEDILSLLSFIEIESAPLVMEYDIDRFGMIFAGALKVIVDNKDPSDSFRRRRGLFPR